MANRLNPAGVNWANLWEVIDYAKSLGPDLSVVKYLDRKNYHVVYKKYLYKYTGATIFFTTEEKVSP